MNSGLGIFQGVIRVHLLEAEKLAPKDNFLGLGGKSDPYAKVSIGLQHCRSRTVYRNLNPTWNEAFEVTLSSASQLHAGMWWARPAWLSCPHGETLARGMGLGGGWADLCNSIRLPEVGCFGPSNESKRALSGSPAPSPQPPCLSSPVPAPGSLGLAVC